VMRVDGRIDQIAAEPPEPRQGAILVRSREPAVADHVRDQNRSNLPGFGHGAPSRVIQNSTRKDLDRAPGRLASRRVLPAPHPHDQSSRLVGRLPVCIVGAPLVCGRRRSNGSERAGSARRVGMLRWIEGVVASSLFPSSRQRCGY
jgi:hypothetical protein